MSLYQPNSATRALGRYLRLQRRVPNAQPVRRVLYERGLRIADLAERLEVKTERLTRWLNGVNVPPWEFKVKTAQALGVRLEECWTPEVLEARYVGTRSGGYRPRREPEPEVEQLSEDDDDAAVPFGSHTAGAATWRADRADAPA